jgi:hypothetical protein
LQESVHRHGVLIQSEQDHAVFRDADEDAAGAGAG